MVFRVSQLPPSSLDTITRQLPESHSETASVRAAGGRPPAS